VLAVYPLRVDVFGGGGRQGLSRALFVAANRLGPVQQVEGLGLIALGEVRRGRGRGRG
jgi:hypothetical protein